MPRITRQRAYMLVRTEALRNRSHNGIHDMTQRATLIGCCLAAATQLFADGCSSQSGTVGIRKPQDGAGAGAGVDAGINSQAGTAGAFEQPRTNTGGTGPSPTSDADGLAVKIEDASHVSVTLITVSCSGECSDVQAVASGGYPPYKFVWEDGSTSATRKLCPTEHTTFRVTATDTGITSAEFAQAPEAVTAQIETQLEDCRDNANADDDPEQCVADLAFEGDGAATETGIVTAPSPWMMCPSDGEMPSLYGPSVPLENFTSLFLQPGAPPLPVASEGDFFLIMSPHQAVSTSLCSPLRAGKPYSVKFDLASRWPDVPVQLAFQGSSASCSKEVTTLWTSPTAPAKWQTFCATFTPDRDYTQLTVAFVTGDDDNATKKTLFVDNMAPVTSCADLASAP